MVCFIKFCNSHHLQDGRAALHVASLGGHVDVVRLLVKAHATVNILDKVKA